MAAIVLATSPAWMGPSQTLAEQKIELFQTISVGNLAALMEQKDFALINVHIPYEGEIPRTDAFIPFDEIGGNLDQLPADKEARIVVYCKSGRMSEIAAAELAGLGYTKVSHVAGGFVAWAKSGQALLQSQ